MAHHSHRRRPKVATHCFPACPLLIFITSLASSFQNCLALELEGGFLRNYGTFTQGKQHGATGSASVEGETIKAFGSKEQEKEPVAVDVVPGTPPDNPANLKRSSKSEAVTSILKNISEIPPQTDSPASATTKRDPPTSRDKSNDSSNFVARTSPKKSDLSSVTETVLLSKPLADELKMVNFESLSKSTKNWLGIGHTMIARFVWVPTIWSLYNSTDGARRVPMVYLNPRPCAIRRRMDPTYQCLVIEDCTIAGFKVQDSLSMTDEGVFHVTHVVQENERPVTTALSSDAKGIQFTCVLRNPATSENFTLHADSPVTILSKRPVPSSAQVIKPTKLKTAIVGTMITIEAVLDKPGLRITEGQCKVNDEDVSSAFDLGRGLYTLEYTVRDGDTDRPLGKLPFMCTFEDQAGNNATVGPMNLQSWFSVNANPPRVGDVVILEPKAAKVRVGDRVVVGIQTRRKKIPLVPEQCLLNGVDVAKSFNRTESGGTFILNITTGLSDWFAGQLEFDCWLKDGDGNAVHVDHFTDGNQLAGDAHTPRFSDYFPNILLAVGFAVVSIASGQIATFFPIVGLPLITGYLLTGILAGPEALGLIPEQSIRSLRFIDELSLSVIAISAGSKLYLPKMKNRWRSIACVMVGLIVFEYGIGAATIIAFHKDIRFMDNMEGNQITAIALMAGALVCARSPASAVAIVREINAEGPFTDTVLGVTVLSDVSVIALFALTSLFSGSLLANRQRSSSVLWVFIAQMLLSSLLGWVFSVCIAAVLSFRRIYSSENSEGVTGKRKSKFHSIAMTNWCKKAIDILECALVLGMSFFTFILGHMFDPYLQPLITCMVGGFVIANFTSRRRALKGVQDRMANIVMVSFFTLAGAALDLTALLQTIYISVIIFAGRMMGIVIGAYVGGIIAGDPPIHNRVSWMAYVTQAGVTLGLAKKIHLENRVWGGPFATVIIACVVLNQLAGPPMFRWAIEWVGETPKGGQHEQNQNRRGSFFAGASQENEEDGASNIRREPKKKEKLIPGSKRSGNDSNTFRESVDIVRVLIFGDGPLAQATFSGLVSRKFKDMHVVTRSIATADIFVERESDCEESEDEKIHLLAGEIDEPSVRISHILELASKYDVCVLMLSSSNANETIARAIVGFGNCAHVKIFMHNGKARHAAHENNNSIDEKIVLENNHRITFSDSISPVTVVKQIETIFMGV